MSEIILDEDQVIDAGGVTFTLGLDDFTDFLVASKQSREQAEALGLDEKDRNVAAMGYQTIARIKDWIGPKLSDGSPAPCTPENVRRLFAKRPQILMELIGKIMEEDRLSAENLEPTQGG